MLRSITDAAYFLKLTANLAHTECRELGDWLEADETGEAMALLDSLETSATSMIGHIRYIREQLAADKGEVA